MPKIKIDDKDYNTDEFTEEAKAQLMSMQFCDQELLNLQMEAASIQTARIAYANALKVEVEKIGQSASSKKDVSNNTEGTETPDKAEKKSLLGGLFGKK